MKVDALVVYVYTLGHLLPKSILTLNRPKLAQNIPNKFACTINVKKYKNYLTFILP